MRAEEIEARTIGFPAISTGIFNYPIHKAAETAVSTLVAFVQANPQSFDRIALVCFDDSAVVAFDTALENF